MDDPFSPRFKLADYKVERMVLSPQHWDQSLQSRFNQYFEHLTDTSRRVNVSKMLRLWNGNLWFCFAPILDINKIKETEEKLINAFLPPVNRKYTGIVSKQIKYLFS